MCLMKLPWTLWTNTTVTFVFMEVGIFYVVAVFEDDKILHRLDDMATDQDGNDVYKAIKEAGRFRLAT